MIILSIAILGLCVAAGGWLIWQLLRQNGRILLRIDELERRLDEFEFADTGNQLDSGTRDSVPARAEHPNGDPEGTDAADPNDRASRFNNRSLARSRIKRDGLRAGTPAPEFRLSSLDGRELSLQDFRGRRLLLVFSDPHCGPCNTLAPRLEKLHREQPEIQMLMISRGDPRENRTKVKEHGLTFPIVLQQQWEISRRYAMFATPIAYLIGGDGVIANDAAVGVEPILSLMNLAAANGIPRSTTEMNRDQVVTEATV